MADFAYDIGDQIGEFEVVSRSENTENGELQYTIISKAHAAARRKVEEERAKAEAEVALQVDAQAAASEEPETLQPKS